MSVSVGGGGGGTAAAPSGSRACRRRRRAARENEHWSRDRYETIRPTVSVYYPFHPLHGQELAVLGPRRRGEAVTVPDPTGVALVIPTWMVAPQAALIQLTAQPIISVRALTAVALLVNGHLQRSSDASLTETGVNPAPGGEREPD
jgi:hypothetical protein